MNKGGIIAYITLFLVLLIFYFYTTGTRNQVSITTRTTTYVPSTATTVTSPSTTTTTAQTSVSGTGSNQSCLSNSPTAYIYNGNFSTGTFLGWWVNGSGFGNRPTNIITANQNADYYEAPWTNLNSGFFATTYNYGRQPQPGSIYSSTFTATEPYLNFRIVSAPNSQLYLEILLGGNVLTINSYNTWYNQSIPSSFTRFANASIYLGGVLCRSINIVVVSTVGPSAPPSQFIAVGDFYLSNTPLRP